MSNEKNPEEKQEEQNNEEEVNDDELDIDSTPDENEEGEEIDWKKEALKERAIKARLKKKLEESSKEKPQPKPITKKKEEKNDDDLRSDIESLKLSERKRQFGYEHNLSPSEVDRVFQITPEPTKETLDDPFVKAGLQAIRSQSKVAENTPSPSSGSSRVTPKKPIEKLSPQEKDKYVQDVLKSKAGR